MESLTYDRTIIEMYVNHLEKYLLNADKIECSNPLHKNVVIYNGFKSILKLLSILHLIKMSKEQINSYLEKSYILYVEYSEQVYLKKTDSYHTPSMFVYNVLIGNIALNAYTDSEKQNINMSGNTPFMRKMIVWNELILNWGNSQLNINQKIYFIKNFLQSYLLLFTNDSKFELFRVFESVLQLFKDDNVFDKYTYFLTSFHNYVSKNEAEFDNKMVEEIIFEKFVRHQDTVKEMFQDVKNIKHMDNLVEWLFT